MIYKNTTWSNLEPYQASRSYTLPDSTLDGSKKLYVRFTDTVGNRSAVTLSVSGAITMQLSLDGGSTWGIWEPYVTTKTVTLPSGDGTKTVLARFQDLAGNTSLTVSDSTSITTAPAPATLTNKSGWASSAWNTAGNGCKVGP